MLHIVSCIVKEHFIRGLRRRICVFTVPFSQGCIPRIHSLAGRNSPRRLQTETFAATSECYGSVYVGHSWHTGGAAWANYHVSATFSSIWVWLPRTVWRIPAIRWSPCAKWVACLWIMCALSAACTCFGLCMNLISPTLALLTLSRVSACRSTPWPTGPGGCAFARDLDSSFAPHRCWAVVLLGLVSQSASSRSRHRPQVFICVSKDPQTLKTAWSKAFLLSRSLEYKDRLPFNVWTCVRSTNLY